MPFFPFRTGTTWGDKLMGYLVSAFDALKKAVTNDHLTRAEIAVTDTRVPHGLGRAVETWDVVDQNANAVIWQSPTVNARADQYILLIASAPVKALIRFT